MRGVIIQDSAGEAFWLLGEGDTLSPAGTDALRGQCQREASAQALAGLNGDVAPVQACNAASNP